MNPWARATLALRLLRLAPDALGGIVVHARPSPARDAFEALLPPVTRLAPGIDADSLTGGIDVTASLAEGQVVRDPGLIARTTGPLLLPMAERAPVALISPLSGAVEAGRTLIAFDEHAEDEPPLPAALGDRLAFHVTLEGVPRSEITRLSTDRPGPLPGATDQTIADITALAERLGIASLRAPLFALTAARAHAALHRRNAIEEDDIRIAAELVLAPRVTRIPEEQPAEEPPTPEATGREEATEQTTLPDELLLAAIATTLPPDLIAQIGAQTSRTAQGSGSGRKRTGTRRGRPLPSRRHVSGNHPRIDIPATLRAAVPWQTLRRRAQPQARRGPLIEPRDLRYRRTEDRADRLLIFTVDASGSAALARLGEAKGAVELLLSQAYARRDHIALIAFRGTGADLLLPPTRALVQAKRRLADLPGGGGTPIATGLNTALETAHAAARKGMTPIILLLTDGRANIALDGALDRSAAAADAQRMARAVAAHDIDSVTIDTSRRPAATLRELAAALGGRYAALPRMDAESLSQAVNLSTGR